MGLGKVWGSRGGGSIRLAEILANHVAPQDRESICRQNCLHWKREAVDIDLFNPTDMPSIEEAKADSFITQAEVTKVVSRLGRVPASGGGGISRS